MTSERNFIEHCTILFATIVDEWIYIFHEDKYNYYFTFITKKFYKNLLTENSENRATKLDFISCIAFLKNSFITQRRKKTKWIRAMAKQNHLKLNLYLFTALIPVSFKMFIK